MNYKDINDKWKSFLFENTFKEDMIINPDKGEKKKSKKKVGPPPKKAKELMTDPSFVVKNEYDEFHESDDQLEETSTISSGAAEGPAGGEKGPWISEKEYENRWGLTEKKK